MERIIDRENIEEGNVGVLGRMSGRFCFVAKKKKIVASLIKDKYLEFLTFWVFKRLNLK